jgi:vesicle coat complex subunit
MSFYDLLEQAREDLVKTISAAILKELHLPKQIKTLGYCMDEDTYIRKCAYLAIGKIYFTNAALRPAVIVVLDRFLQDNNF